MRILQTVKYYEPSNGGMESVVKNIVEGIVAQTDKFAFTVYANNHVRSYKKQISIKENLVSIKETTPFIFKSQPLNISYSSLKNLLDKSDIIHHHYPFPNMEMALHRNFNLIKNKKLVITWHANIEHSRWNFLKKVYDPFVKKMLDRSDAIVVTSPQLCDSSELLNKYKNKIHVIPLCSNSIYQSGIQSPRILDHNKCKQVLFVGKLRSYKGISYLIEAIRSVDAKLTIVGDGEEEVFLKDMIRRYDLNNKVFLYRNVPDDKLFELYKAADLFVLPSVNEAEAFGIVQIEAMALGVPVINTRLNSGVPFVSVDNLTGLTVDPKSSVALSESMNFILNNSQLYNKFSENALERARLFSRESMSASYIKLYNSL